MKTEEAFGIVLQEHRHKKMLSQEELANNCELDRTYISLLERGKRNPSLAIFFIIANELGLRPSELMFEVEKLVEATDKKGKFN